MNRIEKNYNDNKQKIYRQLVKKNVVERDNYLSSLERHLEKQKEITETKKEKAFKKYQSYVSIYILLILLFLSHIVFHNESNKRKKRRKI